MKTRKLLSRIGDFLNQDHTAQQKEIESIRKILKKLKQKENRLREKLATSDSAEDRADLSAKLEVVHAQRQKGLERVRSLRGK